ncbi:MAG: acyl-CoA dehydrogenase family protein [FCB group bacterium]|jgi:alkylation response protein AidB-like acyl-CoA dehydrogenase|nr:acyl-CoA dehydrogenase family protein [FCB group bacterium]
MKITDNQEKQKALDLAEDSREKEWQFPSFVAELFRGSFRWDLIHPWLEQSPEDKRIGDEFMAMLKPVLERSIDADKVDRDGELPKSAVQALAEAGCFGLKIPKEYGGVGLSQTNYNRVVAYIGSYCQSTAVWVSAHQSIGVPQPLKMFGTEEQKKKYLPKFAKGAISAFALTEPNVGSDPAKMGTIATPSEDGSHYILNGEKLWCTNGPVADILIVMAKTPPKIVNGKEKPQITAFIVEADSPGFEVAHTCQFMGIRAISNGLLRFTNVKVPTENIIGKPGDGLKIALTTLNTGRLTMPGVSAGGGKSCVHFTKAWSNERVQWGAPIGKHQAVANMNADIAANTFAMEAMQLLSCAFVDRGKADIRLEAAMAKYFCTEVGWKVVDEFLQVRGGRGYETADSLRARGEVPIPTERMMRDARISRIIEGTSQIMQLFIAREAMDTHVSRIMPIMMAKGGLGAKWPLLKNAMKFYVPWYPKQWIPSSQSYNVRHISPANQDHLRFISKTARKLARSLFHTMAKYQQKLEKEQLVMANYVDIGTDLFAMASALSYAEYLLSQRQGDPALQDLVDLFCMQARDRIKHNFRNAKRNYNRLSEKVGLAVMDGQYDWMTEGIYKELAPLKTDESAPVETLAAASQQPEKVG